MMHDCVLWNMFVAVNTITANIYLDMIHWFVLEQSDGTEQGDKGKMLFQQGGALHHFNHKVRKALNVRFPDRWNGRGEPTPHPQQR
jgi:hypothetical protein